ncbi:Por secretion system C-terminal sorting domain-containing protein [Chryseobacterium rhizoplanae]|uniref:Por secretion system C-terminal sorting domain-containing protein n=1 Tax=Chryseobacterium rhizoplanae TaxID=1609531 RepID=A0A521C3B7_9FLAO|nr:T9SS type A sorting domain-containing protein [Chryseobacterium rhizoplanae]SMO53301.1 Por secretion system C-terminal sorting domain-containing protein [Chryseobacterium rhizoplanae]
MKKIVLSLALASCFYSNAQTLLSESFEGATFPPTGWTKSNTNALRAWDLTSSVFSGTSASSIELKTRFTIAGNNSATIDWVSGANTANLVSPAFSLAGATSPTLSFKVKVGWGYMISLNKGNLLAQISTDGGTNWTTLWNEDSEAGFTDDGDGNVDTDFYNTVTVQKSLSTYIGQANVKVRFQYVANDADAVSIDDVQVIANGTLGTSEALKTKADNISVYPNPTKGEISIKTDKKIKSTSVIDVSGKTLSTNNSGTPDISSLPKGVYLLKVDFSDGTSKTEKVIKQ